MQSLTTELSLDEAKALTERIRAAADQLWQLLLEAHERKAWKALGYASWSEYVSTEFDMSRRHAYRLLDQGRVIRAIEDAGGSVTHGSQITERTARDIKPVLDEVTEEIRDRVEQGADPVQTTYEVIEAKRAERSQPADAFPAPDFGGSKVVSLDERRAAKSEPPPEEDDFEPDLLAELEAASAEIQRQQRLIDSLASGEVERELVDWQQRYAQLEGRLRQQMTTANEATKQAQYYANTLKRIRQELGVEKNSEIIAAIRQRVAL